MAEERKAFLLRIDPKLWAELEAWAADELRSRLAAVAERKLPEAEQRATQQTLEKALASLTLAEDLRAQREALQASVVSAPQDTRAARAQ